MSVFNFRNVIVLLGIVTTTVGIIYFATEFFDRLTEWTRVLALLLLSTIYIALGVHLDLTDPGAGTGPGRWLRVSVSLYLIGVLATFTAVIVFFGIDDVDPVVKVAAVLALGLGLMMWGATYLKSPDSKA